MNLKNRVPSIEVQGHRGDRGNFPENSLPAFLSAVKKGVDVLELDVVISGDRKVVVSHEPVMSSDYMLTSEGHLVTEEDEQNSNLFAMTYDSIRNFDGGSRGNPEFPAQQKMKTWKPLLTKVVDTVENYIRAHELRSVNYNIELKSVPSEYKIYQPLPEEFVDLVMQVVTDKRIEKKVNLQSFDPEPLEILRRKYPDIPIAFLVESGKVEENLAGLSFTPEIYSPQYSLIKDPTFVDEVRRRGLKIIPWTVNEEPDILKMIQFGVDGIITDYPERVMRLLQRSPR